MNSTDISNQIRSRFDHETAKQVLRERMLAKLHFAYNGGMWCAGPELLNVLQVCPDKSAVILDIHTNPVKIDVAELQLVAQQRWQEQMNLWLAEYQKIQQER